MTDNPADDLDQRDLSEVADEALDSEEKQEVTRRLYDFVVRMREKAGISTSRKIKPTAKNVQRWDPAQYSRKN